MSLFATVPTAPPDAIFHLTASYKSDTHPQKVNLGVGAYRTDEGKPWVLPAVQLAKRRILEDTSLDHEYLPIAGLKAFTEAAVRLMLGEASPVVTEGRYTACQTISGTGANSLAAMFLTKWYVKNAANSVCLISEPTWANHNAIFAQAGFAQVKAYKYWDAATLGLDINGMLASLRAAPEGSVVVLHACAHNPTGVDPTQEQWREIAAVMQEKKHVPFFDSAYQGFASGDPDKDAWAVRYFAHELNMECLIAQSFAKNFGIYGERAGCLTVVTTTPDRATAVESQLAKIVRAMYSNPPTFGARIVFTILSDAALRAEWRANVRTMAERIHTMRAELRRILEDELHTPGHWGHITAQIGMFSFTGLSTPQVRMLQDKYHVYMTDNGRISMAGLNTANVRYFAAAVDDAVRNGAPKL